MEKLLVILLFVAGISITIFVQPVGPLAVLFGTFCAVIAVFLINKNFEGEEREFLRKLFIIGLLLRIGLATATYIFDLQGFFGGDSAYYDRTGYALYNSWFGYYSEINAFYLSGTARTSGSGFGMAYIVGAIYSLVGRNELATQFFNSVLGAATCCFIYSSAKNIFNNNRVARISAIFVALFPSLIVWSSQGLKDGIICFLLAVAINTLFALNKKFSYVSVALLLTALFGIYALRFYIFFAFVVATLGSFVINSQKSAAAVGRQVVVLIIITLGLTYLGVLRGAQQNIEIFGNLQTLQSSRSDLARSAESGYGTDIDVSTPTGAIQALPLGLVYLILAPFPWQVKNFRQAVTLPEVFVWWSLMPFLVIGVWYTLKNKLRESIAIILLTLLLTISYAIFQGNVGTAYRMRAQMQIFYFIFVAVGLTMWLEKRENQDLARKNRNNTDVAKVRIGQKAKQQTRVLN